MTTKPTLDALLAQATPHLTEMESSRLYAAITATSSTAPLVSPYFFVPRTVKPFSYVALVLLLLLGAGGTVAASESSKPGDLLFPIDRVTEVIRLALASGDQKVALQNQFISERFIELQQIVNEEKVATNTGSSTDSVLLLTPGMLAATSSAVKFNAKVFTEKTIVQTVIGTSTPVFFTSLVTTTEAIVAAISNRYQISAAFVNARVTVADLNRVSTVGDVGGSIIRAGGESRVANAIAVLAAQLAEQDDSDKREEYLQALLDEVAAVHVNGRDKSALRLDTARVKIDDNRTEVRSANARVRIDQKDGKIEINVEQQGQGRGESDESHAEVDFNNSSTATTAAYPERTESGNSRHESEKEFRGIRVVASTTSVRINSNAETHTQSHNVEVQNDRQSGRTESTTDEN